MSAMGGKQSFGEGIVRFRTEVDISSFERMLSRCPRRTASICQIILPLGGPSASYPAWTMPINPSGNLLRVRTLRRCERAYLGGRLSMCLAKGGTTVALLSVVTTAAVPLTGTSETLRAASRYSVTAHGPSDRNDTANFTGMLLVCGT